MPKKVKRPASEDDDSPIPDEINEVIRRALSSPPKPRQSEGGTKSPNQKLKLRKR